MDNCKYLAIFVIIADKLLVIKKMGNELSNINAIMARLEIDLAPKSKVLVAMSGGVDSSVVAAVLKSLGHDVMGVTLQLYDHGAAVKKRAPVAPAQILKMPNASHKKLTSPIMF